MEYLTTPACVFRYILLSMSAMEPTAGRSMSMPKSVAASIAKPKAITWVTLAFMTTASVTSLRSAPTMVVYGLACVFLYIVTAIVSLMPQALSGRFGVRIEDIAVVAEDGGRRLNNTSHEMRTVS